MPNLKLTNLASYKAYWADVALKHKQIDGYKYGDKDVIRNDNRSDIVKSFLWAQPYEKFKYSSDQSDNVIKTKPASIGFFTVPDSKLFADEETAFDFCESVIEDIVSKLLKDKRGELVDGEWSMIATNIGSFNGKPVEFIIGGTQYIGCELTLDFMDNTNLAYDANKWN